MCMCVGFDYFVEIDEPVVYVNALLYKHQYIMYTVNKVHLYCIVLCNSVFLSYFMQGLIDDT